MTSENRCGIIFLYNGEYGVSTDENGLYYMRARYYNPEIKRFINQDVIIGTITNSPTMNRYAYVQGNPISLADPFGLSPQTNWFMHSVLDVAGMIPVLGFVFDIANAVYYAIEGDPFGCITSAISAIPGLGDAFGAGLNALKFTKASNIVKYSMHMLGNVGSFAKSTYVIGNVAKMNVERYIINGEEFSWKQFAIDTLTVGLECFVIKGSINGLKSSHADLKTSIAALKYESINPKDIRFSQTSVNGSSELIDSMGKNGWKGDPIDVVLMPDGKYTTLDNTRVVAAREVGINVQANSHAYDDMLDNISIGRFTNKKGTPTTWGEAVDFRIKNQNSKFRKNNPFGSFDMQNIK